MIRAAPDIIHDPRHRRAGAATADHDHSHCVRPER
jgi:hypothetical protein